MIESSDPSMRQNKSGIALGRIIRVFPSERMCSVKTFNGPPGLVDLFIRKCPWISMDANQEGDESTSIPRVGSTGLIMFIDGMPFIFGFFRPQTLSGSAENKETPTRLTEGDKIFSTIAGNFISIKSNGLIEIQSRNSLRTIYYPKEGLLAQYCEAYEFNGDGGYVKWKVLDKNLNTTLHKTEYRKDLLRTCCLVEETGFVDATTIRKITVGAILPGEEDVAVPVHSQTLDILGNYKGYFGVEGTGFSYEITPLGDLTVKNVLGSANMSKTGDWTFKTPTVTVSWTATGDMDFKGPVGSASIDKTGNIELKNAVASITAKSAGDFEIKNKAATLKASLKGDVEASNASKCALTMKSSGEVNLTGPVGKMKIDASGKIGIGGPAAELLDLLDQFLDTLINQKQLTMTGSGASGPLNPPAMTKLVAIKTKLKAIKGSI